MLPLLFKLTALLPLIPVNFMEKACGLDVHKDSVFACILDEQGKKIFEKRYGTLTPHLMELRDTLIEMGCGRVAMVIELVEIWNK
jgi:hypothetical protein